MSHPTTAAPATLLVVGGLPATGKSTIAALLARQVRAVHLRIDAIEQAIVEASTLTQPLGAVGYVVAQAIAAGQLANGLTVVADCVNPLAVTRGAWHEVGARHATRTLDVEVVCSDAGEHRRRAETRHSSIPGLMLPTWRDIQEREYEPWDDPGVIVIDTATATAEECVREIRRRAGI
ncbi:MAG: adenylyl-sulfate kinase [Thermoleophilia bacterium]